MKNPKSGWFETNLDETDWTLLELLQQDARLSFAELGRRTSLSAPAAAERVRRLEDAGLITGYHAQVDTRRLGLNLTVWIEIQVKKVDAQRFSNSVGAVPWILECHHVTGRPAFLLKAAVPSVEGLESLIGHLGRWGDTTTSLVLSTVLARREFRRHA